jgi:hypothetical protein
MSADADAPGRLAESAAVAQRKFTGQFEKFASTPADAAQETERVSHRSE